MLILMFFLLFSYESDASPECLNFTYSDCGNENAIIFSINTSRDKCQQYCEITDDCQFYRFVAKPTQGSNCALFQLTFQNYINSCIIRGGLTELTDQCLSPVQNTCDEVQSGDCIMLGQRLEFFPGLPTREDCQFLCEINGDCKFWEFNKEEQTCETFDSSENKCAVVFGPKSHSPDDCDQDVTEEPTPPPPTTPSPFTCQDSTGLQTYPDPDSCSHYWECFNGNPTWMECKYCFRYDEEKGSCEQKDIVDCGDRPVEDCQAEPSDPPCIWPDGWFQDPYNCIIYYHCSDGDPELLSCPIQAEAEVMKQQLYNPVNVWCDWPDRVKCHERPICDSNSNNCQCQGAVPATPDQPCPAGSNGIEPDPFNCRNYIACQNGIMTESFSCGTGEDQYYDGKFGLCSNDEAVCEDRPICSEEGNKCRCTV